MSLVINLLNASANKEGIDQPVQLCSLISITDVHCLIIIIIISILEPVFLYRGLGFLTSLPRRRPLHSERFSGSAESIPSFSLSFFITSSHDFLGLPDLFCATTFSLRTSEIQPVLRSTCPNHLILLVRSTTSKSWIPSFVRRDSELT